MAQKVVSSIKKILVSQPYPADPKSPYFELAKRYGVELVFRPFIKVEPISLREFRAQKVSILDHTAVVFTAKQAIDHFFRLSEEMRIQIPDTMKYICISEAVANYLQKYIVYRKRKISAGQGTVDSLLPLFQKNASEKFLLSLSDVHKPDLANLLTAHNIAFSKAVMYKTVSNDFRPDEPFDYDALVFFSPSGILSLQKSFPDFRQGDVCIGCLGSTTARSIRDAGFRLDFEAPTPEAPSITAALDLFLRERVKPSRSAAMSAGK